MTDLFQVWLDGFNTGCDHGVIHDEDRLFDMFKEYMNKQVILRLDMRDHALGYVRSVTPEELEFLRKSNAAKVAELKAKIKGDLA